MKKVIKDKDFQKAFAYMFWVFLALKFRERNFGDRDHYNGMDSVTKKLVDNRSELYRVLSEDLRLGHDRRISFIKYWRHKFQTHFY